MSSTWFVKSKRAQNDTDYETWIEGAVTPTLNGFDQGDSRAVVIVLPAVRRITPVEAERLQGFPDNWTAGQAKTNRFRQMGNAVTVNVAEHIGKLIMDWDNDV